MTPGGPRAAAAVLVERARAAAAVMRADPAFRHAARLVVVVGGETAVDERFAEPAEGAVLRAHSIAKSVVSTLVGVAARRGLVPSLDVPLADALGLAPRSEAGAALAGQTLRHALTCTRGVRIDGPWDVDEALRLDRGRVELLATAPRVHEPGAVFAYDNGGWLLAAAALARLVGEPLGGFAQRELFAPLGVTTARFDTDADGLIDGSGGLWISADDLARLALHWLVGSPLAAPTHAAAMTSAATRGGPPEHTPYGLGFWIDPDGFFAGGWGGQAVLVRPALDAVVVVTTVANWTIGADGAFTDDLPPGWRAPKDLIVGRRG